MATPPRVTPKTFYLNEQHELSRGEKPGGGRAPQFAEIDWAAKGHAISNSLQSVSSMISASLDPLRSQHYFVMAKPVGEVKKRSKNQRLAADGILSQEVRFDESDSRTFRRLGLDLVDVTADGQAIVHMRPERVAQLTATTDMLGEIGPRERARWVTVDTFGLIPPELRLDQTWVESLRPHSPTDAVVEFQPLLARSEVDILLRAIAGLLRAEHKEGLTGLGTDFSGRYWTKGRITPEALKEIAALFYSVQTLHSPLLSVAAFATRNSGPARAGAVKNPPGLSDMTTMPTVAVLDTGVPSDHAVLTPYRRGSFVAPDSCGLPAGDHGSFVASRVVFGDCEFEDGVPFTPPGQCRYYDVLVGISQTEVDNKSVTRAIEAVVGTAPDVRVFNLSFDTAPLESLEPTKQRENLLLVQDLDNLIFRDDLLVVVAAGNAPPGVQPSAPYPMNYNDPQWQLGSWARSFNSLTCGSFVNRLTPGALVNTIGWPSPFSRVGPGLCESPKPDFSAPGGNTTPTMQLALGLGVWGVTASGLWEDKIGTSYSAPVLAREAALVMQMLQRVCQQGARPYSVTAKAFLALTAHRPIVSGAAEMLAKRTLGRGVADRRRLEHPNPASAVMLWQGILESSDDLARIRLPIPQRWHEAATKPILRLVICWDPPVNAAVRGLWATRKITAHLKTSPELDSLRGTRAGGHESYPVIDRTYDLRKLPQDTSVGADFWLLELSYDQIADYHPGITFTPQQRVAFAAEIYDGGENPQSPQIAVQSLPSALTMNRLGIHPQPITTPVVIRPMT